MVFIRQIYFEIIYIPRFLQVFLVIFFFINYSVKHGIEPIVRPTSAPQLDATQLCRNCIPLRPFRPHHPLAWSRDRNCSRLTQRSAPFYRENNPQRKKNAKWIFIIDEMENAPDVDSTLYRVFSTGHLLPQKSY